MRVQTPPVTRQQPVSEHVRVIGWGRHHGEDFTTVNIHNDRRPGFRGCNLADTVTKQHVFAGRKVELEIAVCCDSPLHLRAGHIHLFGLATAENFRHMLLKAYIKSQPHIGAGSWLKITKDPDWLPTRIDLHTLIAGLPPQFGLQREFNPDLASGEIGQISKCLVLFDLAAGDRRDIACHMAGQRPLRIDPAQPLLEGNTGKIGGSHGKPRKFTLCQAFADQDRPEGWHLSGRLTHPRHIIFGQVNQLAKLRQRPV